MRWRKRRRAQQLAPPTAGSYTYRYDPDLTPPPPAPWRNGPYAKRAVLLPPWVLVRIAEPVTLAAARCDRTRCDRIQALIERDGFETPLELLVDPLGKVSLGDGYHRLSIAVDLDWPHVPVLVKPGDRNLGFGRPLRDMLEILVVGAAEAQGG